MVLRKYYLLLLAALCLSHSVSANSSANGESIGSKMAGDFNYAVQASKEFFKDGLKWLASFVQESKKELQTSEVVTQSVKAGEKVREGIKEVEKTVQPSWYDRVTSYVQGTNKKKVIVTATVATIGLLSYLAYKKYQEGYFKRLALKLGWYLAKKEAKLKAVETEHAIESALGKAKAKVGKAYDATSEALSDALDA